MYIKINFKEETVVKNQVKFFIIVSAILTGLIATGYAAGVISREGSIGKESVSQAAEENVQLYSEANIKNTVTGNVSSKNLVDPSNLLTSEDMEQTADLSGATEIRITDNKKVNITKAGVYIIRGSGKESTVTVNGNKDDNIRLILGGVNISNKNMPAIQVNSGKKIFITTTGNSQNKLEVTGAFTKTEESEVEAVIFSKSDLVLNGTGKLTVTSATGNGISSEDKLKVTGGTYIINSEKHSLEGYNSVIISGGNFTVNTSKDAVHSENSADNSSGFVYISGGTFNINAADDGIQATTFAVIDGGSFKINAAEGIEATHVQINDGDIDIQASDDGINAAGKSTSYGINLEVNGGKINVVMADGDTDAFDSNGNLAINGGSINIKANSAFDFDGTGQMNGGTVIVNGSQLSELTNQMMGGFPGGRGRRR